MPRLLLITAAIFAFAIPSSAADLPEEFVGLWCGAISKTHVDVRGIYLEGGCKESSSGDWFAISRHGYRDYHATCNLTQSVVVGRKQITRSDFTQVYRLSFSCVTNDTSGIRWRESWKTYMDRGGALTINFEFPAGDARSRR